MGHHQLQRILVQPLMMRHLTVCRLLSHLCAFWLAILSGPAVQGQFPAIELHGWSHFVFQRGQATRVRPLGDRLDEVDRIYIWPTGQVLESLRDPPGPLQDVGPASGEFDLDTSDLLPGIYEASVAGRFGLSNPRRFLVTRQAVQRVAGDTTSPGLAQDAVAGTIYEDRCAPRGRKYYRISLKKGQHLEAVVYARQMDSRAIVRAVLRDAAGNELGKGAAVRQWPARVAFDAPSSGDYLLEVYDVLYRGGLQFGYALELAVHSGGGPLPELELDRVLRPVLDSDAPMPRLRFDNPTRIWSLAPQPPQPPRHLAGDSAGSDGGPLVATFDRPDFLMAGSFGATPPLPPDRITPSSSDRPISTTPAVEFPARQGQTVWIEVQSSQWHQLTDPHVLIYQVADGNGQTIEPPKFLAEQNDGVTFGPPDMRLVSRDPILGWTAPATGRFRCVLRDDQGGRRPEESQRFLVEVRPARPGFAALAWPLYPHNNPATAKPAGLQLMRGGTAAIGVIVARRDGFDAPLLVRAVDLPAGVHCRDSWLSTGQSVGSLVLTCDEDAPPWTGSIGVVLVQPDRPQTVHEAVPATVRWGATPERNGIESRLCTALGLHVLASDVSPLSVQLADSQTVQARPGQKVELPIRAIRRSGAEADCIVRPQQLPPKVGLGEVRIPAKATAAKAQMTIAADARPGRYTFWMLTETQVKWRANPQAVTRIETYLGALRGRLESADEPTRRNLESAIALQTAALEQATKAAAERPITVWIPSTPLELEILPPES